MHQRKTFVPVEFKLDGEQGQFVARIAVFNQIDKDGDVTLPGAFTAGAPVKIAAWGHNWGELAVGKGVIETDDEAARVRGQFFLNTQSGQETYKTVKALADLQEWSYGYEPTEVSYGEFEGQEVRFLRKLRVFEASPVLVGAGNDTGTEQLKALKAAIRYRKTETSEAAWDGNAMWANLPSSEAPLRAATAWVDPEGNPDTKAAYKFIHHLVSEEGDVGAASIVACQAGIAVLNGARGGTTIPDEDRQGVYNHLAAHLRDAGLEPADFNKSHQPGLTFAGEADAALAAVAAFAERAQALAAMRAKDGRTLSAATVERLQTHSAALRAVAGDLDALVSAATPPKAADTLAAVLEAETILARLSGVAVQEAR